MAWIYLVLGFTIEIANAHTTTPSFLKLGLAYQVNIYPLVSQHSWLENPPVAHVFPIIFCKEKAGAFEPAMLGYHHLGRSKVQLQLRPGVQGACRTTFVTHGIAPQRWALVSLQRQGTVEIGIFQILKRDSIFFSIFQESIFEAYVNLGIYCRHLRQGGNRWIISWPCGGCETSCSAIGSVGGYFN